MAQQKFFEIEQKYRIEEPGLMRRILRRVKARKMSERMEYNDIYDERGKLSKRKSIIRVRHYGGREAVLTFKGPPLSRKYHKRLEVETPVNRRAVRKILELSGFRIVAHYRKKRADYRIGRAQILLDYLYGVGWFLEIEAPASRIDILEKKLGLTPADRERKTYLEMIRK